jgi:hypothetical protein
MNRRRGVVLALALVLVAGVTTVGAPLVAPALRPAPRPPAPQTSASSAQPDPTPPRRAAVPVASPAVVVARSPDPSLLPSDPLPGEASVWPADGKGISGAVRESRPRLKRCYEAALEEDPDLGGQITAHFTLATVEGEGRVTDLDLETTTQHDALEACVSDVLAELAFDAPSDQVNVTYPLVFAQDD